MEQSDLPRQCSSSQLEMGPVMHAGTPDQQRRGLTLVELLVVFATLGILIALLLPAVQAAREAARRSNCAVNLKQIALATANYADVWGALPAGVQFTFNYSTASQHVAILPFLEQAPLFNAVNFDWVIWSAANTTVMGARLEVYLCPSDPMASMTDIYRGDLLFRTGPRFLLLRGVRRRLHQLRRKRRYLVSAQSRPVPTGTMQRPVLPRERNPPRRHHRRHEQHDFLRRTCRVALDRRHRADRGGTAMGGRLVRLDDLHVILSDQPPAVR